MKIDFSEKNVLVTGASGGIGKAICQVFSDANANVIVHYNTNQLAAEKTLASLSGSKHSIVKADLSKADEVEKLINSIEDVDIWKRTIESNLMGPAYLIYCASKVMRKKGGGKFVNISSRGAFRGEPKAAAYGASKAGLNALGQSMAQALAKDNIYIYTIAPGFVATERVADMIDESIKSQSPLNRVAEPKEVARTALWLASEGNDFLTGCIIDVNGASYLRS
jgi:3-oxoacyl-[acyl-carrier protein] reductase